MVALPANDDGPPRGWRYRLVRDAPGLSANARLVGLVLATYVNGENGQAWPKLETLMQKTSLGRRAVQYALRELERAVIVVPSRARYGRGYAFERRHPVAVREVEGRTQCTPSDSEERTACAAAEVEERTPCAPEAVEGCIQCALEAHSMHLGGAPDAPITIERTIDGKARLKPRRRAREPKPDPFPRPDGVEPQPWADFLVNRRAKKLSNTPTAHKRLLADLKRYADDDWPPGKLVEHAAAKGWGGIYRPRDESLGNGRYSRLEPAPDPLVAAARAARVAEAEEIASERQNQAPNPGPWLALPP